MPVAKLALGDVESSLCNFVSIIKELNATSHQYYFNDSPSKF